MRVNRTGNRYNYYYKFNSIPAEYDYEHNGIVNHIMSKSIFNSNNEILAFIVTVIDNSLIFVSQYINELKNFKNYIKKNR